MHQPSVAIIIINWNSFEFTSQCLHSLASISYRNVEIIVVDNASTDKSGEKLKDKYPEITLFTNIENLGFTGGNNKGIQYALNEGKDYVMLLNNDTVVTESFIEPLIASIDTDAKAGAVQPKILYNKVRTLLWNAGGTFNKYFSQTKTIGEGETDLGQYDQAGETEWITGCCFLVKSEVVRKVGLLDDKFFIYFEDADWSFKIKQLGMKMLYEPTSKIYHEAGMSDNNREKHNEGNVSPFSHYMGVRNHLYFTRRYAKGAYFLTSFIYQIIKISGYCLYFLVRGRFVKLKYSIRGFRDGCLK